MTKIEDTNANMKTGEGTPAQKTIEIEEMYKEGRNTFSFFRLNSWGLFVVKAKYIQGYSDYGPGSLVPVNAIISGRRATRDEWKWLNKKAAKKRQLAKKEQYKKQLNDKLPEMIEIVDVYHTCGRNKVSFFWKDDEGILFTVKAMNYGSNYCPVLLIPKKDVYSVEMPTPFQEKRFKNLQERKLASEQPKKYCQLLKEKYDSVKAIINENRKIITSKGQRRLDAVLKRIEGKTYNAIAQELDDELPVDGSTICKDIQYFMKIEKDRFIEFLTDKPRIPGKKPIASQVKEEVKRLREKNNWSYRKISEQLKKQGITISYTAVYDILKRK